MIGTLQGPWLLGAAILLLALAIRQQSRIPRPSFEVVAVLTVLAVLAIAARYTLGIWAPLHVNGQGPLWIRGTIDPSALAGYGPGYFELFGWAAFFDTAVDRAVFTANVVFSVLSPVLLYATARLLGVSRGGALAAALILAADPVTIRTAASEGYFASLIALVLAVQLALALGVWAHAQGDRLARNLALAAAGLIAACVARIHPMSYLPLALSPLVVMGSARLASWRARIGLTALAAAIIAAVVLATSFGTISTALRSSSMTEQAFAGLPAKHGLPVMALLLVTLLMQRWLTAPWLALIGVCSMMALLATQNAFQQSPLWQLCYQRLFLPGILLGITPFVPRSPIWSLAVAGVGAWLLFDAARPHLVAQTTEQLEYRFLQGHLPRLPARCTLAAVSQAQMRIWEIPSYLVPEGSGQRAVMTVEDLGAAPGDCLLYIRSSLCTSSEARSICDTIERAAPLARVATAVFPPLPSYHGLPYDRPEVEVVIFRVTEHRAGVNDGAAITPQFAQRLYDRVKLLHESDGCAVTRVDTSRFRVTIGVRPPTGAEHAIEVATAAGSPLTAADDDGWRVVASDGARRDCGMMITALERTLRDIGARGRVE
jgi:hypothetical protein